MNDKLIAFAVNFLKSNIEDLEVEAALAVHLGLAENEEDYDGESYDKIVKLLEEATQIILCKENIEMSESDIEVDDHTHDDDERMNRVRSWHPYD
jgi:hypothetical protein